MTHYTKIASSVIALSIAACTPVQPPPSTTASTPAVKAATPPPPSEEEVMKAWMEAGTPDERHKQLQPFIGKWKTESKMWMGPNTAPSVSHGTATSRWVLDGRIIQEEYTGTMMGKPFKGLSLLGFDKIKGKYYATWNDSMSTAIMYSEGDYNTETRELTMHGEYIDPVSKEKRQTKLVTRIESPTHHVFEMYELNADGQQFKAMQIDYRKSK